VSPELIQAIADFGREAAAKLNNPAIAGEPEDQLRSPFEGLLADLARCCGYRVGTVVAVGETLLAAQRTRPDYAVTVHNALVGYIELKAPGKGGDPRRLRGAHDKSQWQRLQCLPNLVYSDGNEFSLWRNGELAAGPVRLDGDISSAGAQLTGSQALQDLFEHFLAWQPQAPTSAKELAEVSARLCRLLREEVTEALRQNVNELTTLAQDWRHLLFPQASDKEFADGYAQAVTFGLLMARARGISIAGGLHAVSQQLQETSSLIGTALQLLTDSEPTRKALQTSLGALERVLEVVDWTRISRGRRDAWLYFYEDFLEVYDNTLRKLTGSYYTPPQVVEGMVGLVDQALRRPGFALQRGLAEPAVNVADPATGTGTFMLGVLRKVAASVEADEGAGAVPAAVQAALARLVGFEMQLGPFAVAQLRVLAEVLALAQAAPAQPPRMYVTDTLGHPDDDGGRFPGFLAPIGRQRQAANRVKRETPITVVIGNPPYKEKAKGRGAWVEAERLPDWQAPSSWGAGAHAKHLRNLYVYFWRWASWKVFDHRPTHGPHEGQGGKGIVAFITVAGFLNGPGFQRMREDLRQRCQSIWVIDGSPEGHQPEASTRIFQGVQQPVCIVLAARWRDNAPGELAQVRWRSLPKGPRGDKFEALQALDLDDAGWQDCPQDGRAPFLPASRGAWSDYPALEDLFAYSGSGVMAGRTWVMAPDAESLQRRWAQLVSAAEEDKERLFHPHLRNGKPGDRHVHKTTATALMGGAAPAMAVAADAGACAPPIAYAFRSFDRQYLIPDARLINQPNPTLWAMRSERQVFLTAIPAKTPTGGPAVTLTGLVPDMDHYKGSFGGRVFPLWADAAASQPNLNPGLLPLLQASYGHAVSAEDVLAYIAAVTAHPAYIERFREDLQTPGLRLPLTADAALFAEAVQLGRRIVWLHCQGERFADAAEGRPAGPPRLPPAERPQVPAGAAIPGDAAGMPDLLDYDTATQTLHVGAGRIHPVPPSVWAYQVSGKQVLPQWFSYRRKTREKPAMGDRRPASPLSAVQPEAWPASYTTDLLNLLHVLGLLVQTEPTAAALLTRLCAGPLLAAERLGPVHAGRSGPASTPWPENQELF
jgi:hypothetical protein